MEGESFVTPMETSERGSVPHTEEDLEDAIRRAREGASEETSCRERAAVKLSRGPGDRSGRRCEVKRGAVSG
jgi:hypothetical protein